MVKPMIVQIRTGKVKHMGEKNAKHPMDRPWKSAIFKEPIKGKIWLTETGLAKDEIGDPKAHGGPEKALFAYPSKHYPYWRDELHIDIDIGAMGENLVLEDADEAAVCIGDKYEVGEAVIQVSQPRRPCWKPARRFRVMDFALRIQHSGRTGWYFRVIKEGYIESNSHMKLLERPHPEWSIATANEVMYERKEDLEAAAALYACQALAPNWKRSLGKRLEGYESDVAKRVYGPNKDR